MRRDKTRQYNTIKYNTRQTNTALHNMRKGTRRPDTTVQDNKV